MSQYWKLLAGIASTLSRYAILLTAVAAAFGGSLRGSFHLNDFSLLANPLITQSSGLYRMWSPLQTQPLTNLTFWLNYRFGGKNPFGYHLVNLLLHAIVVLLLFYILQRVIHRNAAMVAAVVFAIHPIQSEAVAYVSARGLLLGAVFCLFSWVTWLNGSRWATAVWFGIALMATPECAAFPVLLLLASMSVKAWKPVDRRPLQIMFGMAALALIREAFAIEAGAASEANVSSIFGAASFFEVQGVAVFRYLRLLVIPWGFTIDPDIQGNPIWVYILAWSAIAALAVVAWRYLKGLKEGFWAVAGLVLLVPSSTIFPSADAAADQRMYIPMIAFAAMLGVLSLRISPPPVPVYPPLSLFKRTWRGWILVFISIALVLDSAFQMETWRTEKSLWTEAIRQSPDKLRPLLQLSSISRTVDALDLMVQAKAVAPNNFYVASQLGVMWLRVGHPENALLEFNRALALRPNDARAFSNRGAALVALHQERAAQRDFEAALRIDPCHRAARVNMEQLGGSVPVCVSARP